MRRSLFKISQFVFFRRVFWSILEAFVFVVGYQKTDDISYDNVILANVVRFGSVDCYSMYLKGCVVYFPLFFILAYVTQIFIDNYIDFNKRWKWCTVFLAILMASGRVISDSYYYAASWDFIFQAKGFTLVLFLGWFSIIWKIISALFNYLLKHRDSKENIKVLEGIEQRFGSRGLFFVIWAFFLICWLPRLLLQYPFHIDWDTTRILRDVIAGEQTTGYTGQMQIMRFFLKAGEWIGSSYLALFIYMAVMYLGGTLLFSFIFFYFQQKSIPKGLWYVTLTLVLFFPLVQGWIVFISKDANYSVAVTSFVLNIYILVFDKPFVQKHKILFYMFLSGSVVAVLFLRMNGIFVIGATFFVILVMFLAKNKNIIRKCVKFFRKKAIFMCITIIVAAAWLIVSKNSINAVSNSGYFCNSLKYYFQGRILYSVYEIHARKAADMDLDNADGLRDILGKDYEAYMSSQYGYGTNWSLPYYMDVEKCKQVTKYLIKHEPRLCVEAMITIWYAHFDFLNGAFYKYGSVMGDNAFLHYGMDEWYNQLAVRQNQYFFLEDTDKIVQNIPILKIFFNTGTYIWLVILTSVFFVLTKRKQALVVCLPLYITLVGSCLSSYNANIRICLPIVLGVPILLLMCPLKDT